MDILGFRIYGGKLEFWPEVFSVFCLDDLYLGDLS